jgi:S-methylmethionine-dependent homocysteine/selenocysteine methylase
LRRKGIEVRGEIGSTERFLGVALANVEQPSIVEEAHEEYIKAGSHVITTNSYACVPRVVGDTERVLEVIQAAGKVARAAADRHGALVAGSLPPLNASYRADLVPSLEEMTRDYALIAENIAPYADVLLCETMSCAREAKAAMNAAVATGKPVWVSWTLAEDESGNLISGESIDEAVDALELVEGGPVEACMFNCCQPESITAAFPRLRARLPVGVKFGAYANGFLTCRSPGKGNSEYRDDMTPIAYAALCQEWQEMGASILGGCCGIFPEHIADVSKAFKPQSSMRIKKSAKLCPFGRAAQHSLYCTF